MNVLIAFETSEINIDYLKLAWILDKTLNITPSHSRQCAVPALHTSQDGEGQESAEEPEAAQPDAALLPADVRSGRGLGARPQGRRQGQWEVRWTVVTSVGGVGELLVGFAH